MSRAAKLTLLGTTMFAATTVGAVHYWQQSEKDVRPSHIPPATPLSIYPPPFLIFPAFYLSKMKQEGG